MRVLFLVDAPRRRGAEIFASQLASWLRAHGHVVRVVYLHRGGDLAIHSDDVVLSIDKSHVLERAINPFAIPALAHAVSDFRPDIVQVNGAQTVKYGAALRVLQCCAPWKIVYRNIGVPSYWVRGRAKRWIYSNVIMPRMQAVVAVSAATLADVSSFYRLSCPHLAIPNGVDIQSLIVGEPRSEVRRRLGATEDEPILVFIGALSPEKRPDRFVELVASTGYRGWVIGDGAMRATLEKKSERLGAQIAFLGRLQHVADVVAAADANICCSDTEGIPGAVLEAAWLRVPTIAFDVGGLAECVTSETGRLVPPGDLAGLASAVRQVITDPHRERLGDAAQRMISERFALDVVGRQYEAFYSRLAFSR